MKHIALASLMTTMLALAGCVPRSYEAEQHFGDAVHESLSMQIVNPEGTPPGPVVGLDGEASRGVMERYVRTFQAPPPQTSAFSIGVGSGGGAMTTPALIQQQ